MAVRKDSGKRLWHLLPVEAMEEVLKVLEFGAGKYSDNNWRTPPYLTRDQIVNSLKRHQAAIDKGELTDSESGLLHSAHVACNALFQLHYEVKGYFNSADAFIDALRKVYTFVPFGVSLPKIDSFSPAVIQGKCIVKPGMRVRPKSDMLDGYSARAVGIVIAVNNPERGETAHLQVRFEDMPGATHVYASRLEIIND